MIKEQYSTKISFWSEDSNSFAFRVIENGKVLTEGKAKSKYEADLAAVGYLHARLMSIRASAVAYRHMRPNACFKFYGEPV